MHHGRLAGLRSRLCVAAPNPLPSQQGASGPGRAEGAAETGRVHTPLASTNPDHLYEQLVTDDHRRPSSALVLDRWGCHPPLQRETFPLIT